MKRGLRRGLKVMGALVGVLLGAVVGGVVFASCRLDSIVESGIERHGTELLGTAVEVGGVELSWLSGEGALTQVEVRNAPSFRELYLFEVGEARVALEPWSVLASEGPVRVREILVDGATITLEARPIETNLGWVEEHLEAARSSRSEELEALSERRLSIDRFVVKGSRVRLVFHGPLRRIERSIAIPPVEVRDLGRDGGATPEEVAREVLRALVAEVRAGAGRTPGPWQDVVQRLRDRLQERRGEGGGRALPSKLGGRLLDRLRQRRGDAGVKAP